MADEEWGVEPDNVVIHEEDEEEEEEDEDEDEEDEDVIILEEENHGDVDIMPHLEVNIEGMD